MNTDVVSVYGSNRYVPLDDAIVCIPERSTFVTVDLSKNAYPI